MHGAGGRRVTHPDIGNDSPIELEMRFLGKKIENVQGIGENVIG
jgi:hypothetical protein